MLSAKDMKNSGEQSVQLHSVSLDTKDAIDTVIYGEDCRIVTTC